MSVASHLAISPAQYDARIRSLIPLYDELIAEGARALGHTARCPYQKARTWRFLEVLVAVGQLCRTARRVLDADEVAYGDVRSVGARPLGIGAKIALGAIGASTAIIVAYVAILHRYSQ